MQSIDPAAGVKNETNADRIEHKSKDIIKGIIVDNFKGGQTFKEKEGYLITKGFDKSSRRHHLFNMNCPDNIGWYMEDFDLSIYQGRPFKIGDAYHFPGKRSSYSSICENDAVYVYMGFSRENEYRLNIEKRSTTDFQELWSSIVIINNIPSRRDNTFYISSVTENHTKAVIELVDRLDGNVFVVETEIKPINN